jgi:aspartate/methionine/tyrosine aminotransferase
VDLSPLATQVPPSGIREIVNLVINRPPGEVLRLEVGEPDFRTPAHIVEAAAEAAARGVGYTQSSGILPLREALGDRIARVGGLRYEPTEIVVTQGGVQGVSAVFAALLSPGDEVLIPDPAWPNYEMLALLRGAVPVHYALPPDHGFVPDPAEVESLVTPRTRAIVFNSPANPTGAVIDASVVEAMVRVAERHGIWLVSDEVYDELIFEGEPANAAQYGRDAVVGIYSFSKNYAMTGWRVGYVAAPPELARLLTTIQEPLVSCISGVSQYGALAALEGPQDCVAEMRDSYRRRRDLMVSLLSDAGFDVVRPHGAFYQMLPFAPGVDSRAAALDLVDHGVAVAPGTAFGTVAADHARLSLASSEDTIRGAVERIAAWAERSDRGAALMVQR